ncbi:uncharacterized protein (DUF885 family) [Rhodanobacter sp. K2T2]|uniref:DUF885 domain-containing protein n=1 Tax=Rhodanobacter sp. K2T2 TaxID=2723085 RepID=UPI0015CE2C67|nr:DUF885 family protein [Rhodanobacter sp. K2T2]NYE30099.1 uncharacterized protein (DUF885 family) [Rhodanobacter sp. K2T2]
MFAMLYAFDFLKRIIRAQLASRMEGPKLSTYRSWRNALVLFLWLPAFSPAICHAFSGSRSEDLSSRLAEQNALFVRYEKNEQQRNVDFPDRSFRSIAKEHQDNVILRTNLAAISTDGFAEQDLLSHEILLRELDQESRDYDLKLYELPLAEGEGIYIDLAELGDGNFQSAADYADYLKNLREIPRVLRQAEDLARLGIKDDVLPARYLLEKVVTACDDIITEDPFLRPTKKFPTSISTYDQDRITAKVTEVVNDEVIPAYKSFRDFVKSDYAPHARRGIGLSSLPRGAEMYQNAIHEQTTTNMTPVEIHDLGLREVARIQGLLQSVAHRAGYASLASYRAALKIDSKYRPSSPEQIVDDFHRYVSAMQPRLPDLFEEYPKTLLTVEAGSPTNPGFGTHFVPGSADGSRPGRVVVAVSNFSQRSLISDETQAYHEGIPGHALQVAIQQHLKGLPEFRSELRNTAYVEGWAVYAEALGKEIGFFQDPASDYGRLNLELMRAVRLVVDTGINAGGWTREQAVSYFRESGAADEPSLQAEIDRYVNWPAQSLGYKIGQLKFIELRERARRELGPNFDIRKYHEEVLDAGSLPLDLLEARVDHWIEREKSLGRPSHA